MDHTKELIISVHNGDRDARDTLVSENMGLVYSSARKYAGRGYDIEDIIQIGVIGLIKAIDRFDITIDVRFSTYAVIMIIGEIKRFLRDDGMVKISRSIKENGIKIKKAREELSNILMREPTVEELAENSGVQAEDVIVAQEAMQEVESIHKTVYQSDGNEVYLIDRISDSNDQLEGLIDNMLLRDLLEGLNEEERNLIKMRYFDERTQTEIAKELGISQVQVSRMEKRILLAMRRKVV